MAGYALDVGLRYLRSKKRASISVISVIAISGVALGVAALLAVMSITSGFQREFRDKVLGVNAHVLVLKYGLNFDEYRDVIARANKMPEVSGAAPFIINEMMLAKGDRLSGVLVKGVDPVLMPKVLDLPSQLIAGSLQGLRLPGAAPPVRADNGGETDLPPEDDDDLDAYLTELARRDNGRDPIATDPPAPDDSHEASAPRTPGGDSHEASAPRAPGGDSHEASAPRAPGGDSHEASAPRTPGGDSHESARVAPAADSGSGGGGKRDATAIRPAAKKPETPAPKVPTPEEMEAALASEQLGDLPDDAVEAALIKDSDAPLPEVAERRNLPGIVVGATLARELDVILGDQVKIISPLTGIDTSLVRSGTKAPKSRDYRVTGIFQAGFQEYDSKLVYVDLYEAQAFQDQGDTVIGVELSLHDIDKSADVALRLERDLGGGPFHTMDWRELNHNLFTALEMQKIMLSLVIATIIFVAAFNVVATLIMIVLEKRREIAILKAMGAKDLAILQIFMVQGAAIGSVGTSIGLAIGGVICAYLNYFHFPLDPKVYLIDHLPIRTSLTEFISTVLIALGICVTATLIPSLWAARMLPAEGVRPQ